ncbi:hypothetical protein EBU91_00485 [bacterium]|nr:hypothetical protein [bacterium]
MAFKNLPKPEQEKLIEKWRYVLIENEEDWEEPVFEQFKSQMLEYGIDDVKIEYSGFHSQGDGASFTGSLENNALFFKKNWNTIGRKQQKWLDLKEVLSEIDDDFYLLSQMGAEQDEYKKTSLEDLKIDIVRDSYSRHYHSYTIKAHVELWEQTWPEEDPTPDEMKRTDQGIQNLEDQITSWAREKSEQLYRELEKYFDKLTSDEAVLEWLEENFDDL